jgi:hypothetical protein
MVVVMAVLPSGFYLSIAQVQYPRARSLGAVLATATYVCIRRWMYGKISKSNQSIKMLM